MFHFVRPGPQPVWKRPVYLASTTLLGMLFVFLGYVLWGLARPEATATTGVIVSSPLMAGTLFGLGAVGGWLIGRIWWRLVYVERRWAGKQ